MKCMNARKMKRTHNRKDKMRQAEERRNTSIFIDINVLAVWFVCNFNTFLRWIQFAFFSFSVSLLLNNRNDAKKDRAFQAIIIVVGITRVNITISIYHHHYYCHNWPPFCCPYAKCSAKTIIACLLRLWRTRMCVTIQIQNYRRGVNETRKKTAQAILIWLINSSIGSETQCTVVLLGFSVVTKEFRVSLEYDSRRKIGNMKGK